VATSVLRSGPLSWQQESLLLRPSTFGAGEIHTEFTVPPDVTDDELLKRAQRLADRESALRVIDYSLHGVTFQDALTVRLHSHECGSYEEAREFIARMRHQDYPRAAGEPVWRLTVLRHRDHEGRYVRTAVVLFDHFVVDRYSVDLVRRELSTGEPTRDAADDEDGYGAWVIRQRAEFDPDTHAGRAAARFWQRHLDGASPNQSTPVPVFTAAPSGGQRGTAWYSVRVPLEPGALRRACRAGRATPAVLALASITATTAAASGTDDLVLRLLTSGRTPRSAKAIGWLNTSVPLRLQHRELGTLQGALAAVRENWQATLPYQHTPWEYVWQTCAPAGSPTHGWLAGHRQLLVNFFPDAVGTLTEADFAERTDDFQQHYLALYVVPLTSGDFMFRMIGDVDDVEPVAARRFLNALRDDFITHVRALDTTQAAIPFSAGRP
jgi:hypothetical protein